MGTPKPVLKTPAASPPMDLPTLKTRLKVPLSVSDFDEELQSHLDTAIGVVEDDTNHVFLDSTWTLEIGQVAGTDFAMPRYNVTAVDSVTYLDEAGSVIPVDAGDYRLISNLVRPVLFFRDGWPQADPLEPYPFVITYQAGYADNASIPRDMLDHLAAVAKRLWEGTSSHEEDFGKIAQALHRRKIASYMP